MNTKHTLSLYRRLLTGAVFGFALALLHLPAAAAANDTSDQQTYTRGLQAWQQNCARCHNIRAPQEYPDDLWKPVVTHMRIRAGLTGQQARDILKFLQSSN